MSQGNRKVQYLVTFAVCLASVSTGVVLTWTTPAIPKLLNNETNIVITKEQISWVAAMGSPGFVAGSLVSRYISDRFGRRATILMSALPVTIGTIFTVSSNSVWFLYFTRFLWGVGTGMVVTISPIYLAEISEKEIRGLLTLSSRFMFTVGNFLVMVIGSYVTYDTLNYMLLVLPVMFFIACWFIPETPYFTLKEGKVDTAKRILMKLRKYKDEKKLEEDLESMQKDVKKETLRSGSLKELFTGRQYRKAVIICTGQTIDATKYSLVNCD
ncbi:hypothetical protein evm_010879 [Chilo suppressalis]|nr:hypothetical protein evm_010879 [Chilo suppressalis]